MDKREKIIEAATQLFLENGIEKTTISHIVKHAGIAQGTFYLYFPTKLAVMPAIAQNMVTTVHDKLIEVPRNLSTVEKLEQCIAILFDNTKRYQELTKLMYTGLTQTEEVKQWETIYTPLYSWVYDVLRSGQTSGDVSEELDAQVVAKIFVGAIESTAEQIYLFDESPTKQVAHVKANLLHILTSGLR